MERFYSVSESSFIIKIKVYRQFETVLDAKTLVYINEHEH